MLTCKSLFGLGYRGERLIEPLRQECYRWLRAAVLVLGVYKALGETVELQGSVAFKPVAGLGRGLNLAEHSDQSSGVA